MALDNAQFISELSITDPPGSDEVSEGDDQIRTIKRATQQSFPNVDAQVTLSAAQLNDVALKSVANVFPLAQIMPGIDADTDWTLRVAGGVAAENAIIARANGAVELYHDNIRRLETSTDGRVRLASDGSTDAENRRLEFTHQDGNVRGFAGHIGTSDFRLSNTINGGLTQITAQDLGSLTRFLLIGDPEGLTMLRAVTDISLEVANGETAISAIGGGSVELYHNNIQRLSTAASGVVELRSDGDTDTELRRLQFHQQGGLQRGHVGYAGDAVLTLRNLINSGLVTLAAADSGGVFRTILSGNPNGAASLNYIGVNTCETAALASGGFLVRDIGNVSRKVGFRNPGTAIASVSRTLLQADEQTLIVATQVITLTVNTLEQGTQIDVLTEAGPLTLSEGNVTLRWLDGGGTSAPLGNRTVARSSIIHLAWETNNVVDVWGNGIT